MMKIDGTKVKTILNQCIFHKELRGPTRKTLYSSDKLVNYFLYRLSSTTVHLTGATRKPTQLKTDLKV